MRLVNIVKFTPFLICLFSTAVFAVPVLQLGPSSLNQTNAYDTGSDTWILDDGIDATFSFDAYYKTTNTTELTAYLVFAAVPELTTDVFNITVSDGSSTLTKIDEGYGTPPFEDPNSIAPHGIYDTWSEIYELTFNGGNTSVCNTEPGSTGDCTTGKKETITVTINSLDAAATGIHIDMFTANWDANNTRQIVTNAAPNSHDAQWDKGDGFGGGIVGNPVPIPAAAWLFGVGLLTITGLTAKRRRKS